MKQLYKYQGAVYNGKTIYKTVTEYIHADTQMQALMLLGLRMYKKCKIRLWMDMDKLSEVTS